jgi:hypothetical protein
MAGPGCRLGGSERTVLPPRLERVRAPCEQILEDVDVIWPDVVEHVSFDDVHRLIATLERVETLGGHRDAQDAAVLRIVAAAHESAPLKRGDDDVHRLRGDERRPCELRRRHSVVCAQDAQRHVLRRCQTMRSDSAVETAAEAALEPVHEVADARTGLRGRVLTRRRQCRSHAVTIVAGGGGTTSIKVVDNDLGIE